MRAAALLIALAALLVASAALPAAFAALPAGVPEAADASQKRAKRAADRCKKRARCAQVRRPALRPAAPRMDRLVDLLRGGSPAPEQPEPPGPGTPGPGTPAPPRFVSVAAREFSLTLSRPLVATGTVTVELRNSGEDPHNLVVSPEGSHTPLAAFSVLDPGLYERRSVALQPGRYLLWCSLEFHEGLGMSNTLRVQ